ncbi:MAG: hypothetical protein ACRDY3_04300, partial [Acidimicrobiales bacterium]
MPPPPASCRAPGGNGYWLVGEDGGAFSSGKARFFGSLPQIGVRPSGAIVGITPTRDGKGYWLVGAGAGYDLPVVALSGTASGDGYLKLYATGGAAALGRASAT